MAVNMINPIQKTPERSKLENFATAMGILTGLGNLGVGVAGLGNKASTAPLGAAISGNPGGLSLMDMYLKNGKIPGMK